MTDSRNQALIWIAAVLGIAALIYGVLQTRAARAKAMSDCAAQGGVFLETGRRHQCSFVPKKQP